MPTALTETRTVVAFEQRAARAEMLARESAASEPLRG